MLTMGLYGLLAIAVMAAVFFVVASVLPAGEQIAPVVRDDQPWELPADHALGAEDVCALRLPVALRGYRFAEVDQLLDRLGEELRARDEVIASLRGHEPSGPETEPDEPAGPETEPDGRAALRAEADEPAGPQTETDAPAGERA